MLTFVWYSHFHTLWSGLPLYCPSSYQHIKSTQAISETRLHTKQDELHIKKIQKYACFNQASETTSSPLAIITAKQFKQSVAKANTQRGTSWVDCLILKLLFQFHKYKQRSNHHQIWWFNDETHQFKENFICFFLEDWCWNLVSFLVFTIWERWFL